MALFVAVLLISNIVATKLFVIGKLVFDGGAFIFPLSYIFGDILTEVYGYARSRRVIWTGFFCLFLMSFLIIVVGKMPPAPGWGGQEAYMKILGFAPRLVIAGLIGYFWGEFSNSFILARMKIITNGRWLWTRTIGSTIVGEFVDTAFFCTIAFYGVIPPGQLINYTLTGYFYKTAVEIVMTPVTYLIVGFLKRKEQVDWYDRGTDFNPFHLGKIATS